MNVRNTSLAVSCLSLALLSSLARAQEPPAPSFEGTFKNDDVTLTLKKTGDISYSGSLTASGQEMAIDGAGVKGGQLSGSFKGPDGEKFTFFAVFKEGKVELTSEDVVQLLDPVAPPKPARPNPLAKPSKPNPLAKPAAPAKPNPLARPKPGEDVPGQPDRPPTVTSDDPADMPAVREASAAMDVNDYAKAWAVVKPLIEKGNVRGLFLAALMYQNGNGVAANGVEATAAYERAGQGGFSYAWDNLGVMYRDGKGGVAVDLKKAMDYFAKGVKLGNSGSALNLGALHANGQGTPRDFVRACAYYQLSDTDLARKNKAQLEGLMKPDEIAQAKALAEQIRADMTPSGPAVAKKDDDDDKDTPGGPGGVPVTFAPGPGGSFVVKTAPKPDGDTDPFNDPPFSMLKPGDVLLEVDGKPVKGLSQAQLDAMLAGEADSNIQLSLKRPGEDGGIQIAAPRVAK